MRTPLLLLVAALVSCESSPFETASGAVVGPEDPLGLDIDLATCSRLPAGFNVAGARAWSEGSGKLILSPASPAPGQEVILLVKSLFPRYYGEQSARVVYTTNGWGTVTQTELTDVCPGSTYPIYGLALGSHPDGTIVKVAVNLTHPPTFQVRDSWMNNRGDNYAVEYQKRTAWLGGSELRVAVGHPRNGPAYREFGYPLDPALVAAGHDLSVATRTYPMGAVPSVMLHWEVEGGERGDSAMSVIRNGAGPYGNDTEWLGALPARVVTAGASIRTWVTGVDGSGAALEESVEGTRRVLEIRPRQFAVEWGGKFGAWHPSSRSFGQGGLFHVNGSEVETTTGCRNGGASLSSYRERALRVWIPGLSDHSFSNEETARAYTTLLRAELVTEDGETMPARVLGKTENDFVIGFLPFTDLCSPADSSAIGLPEGDHAFRLRVSVDGGQTWKTIGDGEDGQGALDLHFRASCSYFDSPGDC